MSRQHRRKPHGGPKLPFVLQQRLDLQDGGRHITNKSYDTHVGSRKDPWKEMGRDKRTQGRNGTQHQESVNRKEYQSLEERGDEGNEHHLQLDRDDDLFSHSSVAFHKSNLKKRIPAINPKTPTPYNEAPSIRSRGSSPEIVLDASSRTYKDRMAQNDAEIATLEKKLGIRNGKKRKSVNDDFDAILGSLDTDSEGSKEDALEKEWLDRKRRKIEDNLGEEVFDSDNSGLDQSEDEELEDIEDMATGESHVSTLAASELASDEDGESDTIMSLGKPSQKDDKTQVSRVRENPYRPPIPTRNETSKYIPPSLRKLSGGDHENLEKLRRQVQGQLNKLSEANMISILGEIEKIYQSNPRQDTTSVLIENILSAFSIRSALQNTFIILHAAFLAAVYKVLGNDFGAELICKLVEQFDKFYGSVALTGKESLNLISLLANLFTFNVVSSLIIYDHIRLLLSEFSESNAELLLRVIRDCGPQLRSDDPTALRGIVQTMHNTSAELVKEGHPVNIRTRVMMDTITDLKNNKMKQATNAAGVTGEHITRMRKSLGSLTNRQLRGTEPLRLGRDDIANREKTGKWWLTGASWKGSESTAAESLSKQIQEPSYMTHAGDDFEIEDDVDFSILARRYKMNNDVRRSIFVAVMSAEDAHNALTRIGKLRLKRKQEPEIARVLLSCCRAEPNYNQYYAVLGKNLLRDKRHKMSFQIALWKFFETIGENNEEDDSQRVLSDGDVAEPHEIVNIAKMYAFLVGKGCLNLDVLKTLNVGFTKEQGTLFLELLLVSVLCQGNCTEDATMQIFGHTEPRQAKSLRYFMREKVQRSDLVGQPDRSKLKKGCKVAIAALGMVETLNTAALD